MSRCQTMSKKKSKKTIEELLEEALVPEEEQPYDVIDNWSWVRLGQMAKFINGDRGKNYPSKKDLINEGIPFINAGHLNDGKINLQNMNYISEEKYNSLGNGKVINNDILYCLRGTLGKTAIINDIEKGAIASSLVILRPNNKISYKYLYYYLISSLGMRMIKLHDNGSAQPNLSANNVKKYTLPLPPTSEQKRIADKVERLLNKIDEAKKLIDEAKQTFELRRAAILDKAFRGELTKESQIQKNSNENHYNSLNTNFPYSIPESWEWKNLKDVASFKSGYAFKSKDFTEEGIQLIRMGNLYRNSLWLERNPVYIPFNYDQKILDKYTVKNGDILLSLTGTKYKRDYGYAVKVNGVDNPLLLNQRILSIKPSILDEYIFYYLLNFRT